MQLHTVVYLIRHGATEGDDSSSSNRQMRRFRGHKDVLLSEKGKGQIEAAVKNIEQTVVDYGPPLSINKLYSSDLSRAVMSASIISRHFRIESAQVAAFRERNFGSWEGLSLEEIQNLYTEDLKNWKQDPSNFAPTGGESTAEVAKRVLPAFDGILAENAGKVIAIAAHGNVNRIIICHTLGIDFKHMFRIEQDYACINRLEFNGNKTIVRFINYC
ncbi:MAG: histidine phosphatase family protein [Candidatus Magnetoovum sp. WYHC-5]|nr:histidine phosphatase family protein [Candidatus Magnetoovum sp. WYHC-5]